MKSWSEPSGVFHSVATPTAANRRSETRGCRQLLDAGSRCASSLAEGATASLSRIGDAEESQLVRRARRHGVRKTR
jgi:hypothetical protein